MSVRSDLINLYQKRSQLVSQLTHTNSVNETKAATRKRAVGLGIRDVFVQSLGTVLGGAVLALLALLVGAIPRDPLSIAVSGILTVVLIVSGCISIKSWTDTPITSSDWKTLGEIESMDAVIDLLKKGDDHSGVNPKD